MHVHIKRCDDTKTLKSAVLEWLVPRGQAVIPPLSQNIKSDRGFNHEVTGSLKSSETAGHSDQWPMFLYAGYDYDPEDPWKGLLRSRYWSLSPSSVDKEPKAIRSGNAYLHGMKFDRFSLHSSSVFSRTDTVTDSEKFYHSILDLLEDLDESEEVADLMTWWMQFVNPHQLEAIYVNALHNRIFPNSSSSQHRLMQLIWDSYVKLSL
ncbi:hypothetical protein F4604DRAFT_1882641 [Suillus subluteus]|nr:hypothetical protein F4604DRAFT_1882641 [Suillus subluteus]